MQHPNDRQLQLYVGAHLDAREEKAIEKHLDQCPDCEKRVSDLERTRQGGLVKNLKAAMTPNDDFGETAPPPPASAATEFFSVPVPLEPSAFAPGSVLAGKFKLEKQLGRGGMGEAWKAYDTLAERHVVLKFVPKEIQHIKAAIDSVKDSFKKVHALQHQHICPVYDLFQDEGHGLCLVMKFIDGMPLDEFIRKRIEKGGKMSFVDAVQILWGIAKGLDYAHEKKVIHRDIKPQNVMIGKTDGVQIIDFGLAEEIRTSMAKFSEAVMEIAGTRPYMAPEQWRGRLQDARTDQYALAATAYELFAGHPPFQGSDVGILRECVLNDDPEPIPGLPEHVNTALLKALAKKREDRFPDCKSFVKALATKPKDDVDMRLSVVESLPSDPVSGVTAPPIWVPPISMQSTATKPRRAANGWRFALGGVAVLAVGAVLFGLFGFFSANAKQPPSIVAQQSEPPKKIKPADEVPPPPAPRKADLPVSPPAEPPKVVLPVAAKKKSVRITCTLNPDGSGTLGMEEIPKTEILLGDDWVPTTLSNSPGLPAFKRSDGSLKRIYNFSDRKNGRRFFELLNSRRFGVIYDEVQGLLLGKPTKKTELPDAPYCSEFFPGEQYRLPLKVVWDVADVDFGENGSLLVALHRKEGLAKYNIHESPTPDNLYVGTVSFPEQPDINVPVSLFDPGKGPSGTNFIVPVSDEAKRENIPFRIGVGLWSKSGYVKTSRLEITSFQKDLVDETASDLPK